MGLYSARHHILLFTATATTVFLPCGPVAAQEAASSARDETQGSQNVFGDDIVVTATRREQSVNRVGISITALDGGQLEDLRINEPEKLALVTPGVTIAKAAGSAVSVVTIRGSGNSDFAAHHETPNAVYFDGVYAGASTATSFPVFDLDRVEVLRGPQGTLFGRNATGGLLHFISAKPSRDFDGGVEVAYGRFDQRRLEAHVSGGLSESLSARLSGFYSKSDGNLHNLGGADLGAEDRLAGRLQLLFVPTDDTEWHLIARGFRERSREGVYDPVPSYVDANGISQFVPTNVDVCGTGPGRDFYGYREDDGNPFVVNPDLVGRIDKDVFGFTSNFTHEAAGLTFASLTDYTRVKSYYLEDTDSTPFAQTFYDARESSDQFSQELRINDDRGEFRWVAGLYFLLLEGRYNTRFALPTLANLFDPATFPDSRSGAAATSNYKLTTTTAAAFVQAEYDLASDLTLIAGARWTADGRKLRLDGACVETAAGACDFVGFSGNGGTINDLGTTVNLKQNINDWSGRIEVDWRPATGTLLYASASKGLKGGGFTVPLDGLLTPAQLPYRPEKLYAYEAGVKTRILPGLRLNGSTFLYDYKDFQTFLFDGLTSVILNRDGTFKGGELEAIATPLSGLDLVAGASYLDAKVKGIATAAGVQSQRPINAPKWKFNWLVRNAFDLGRYSLVVQYDGNYAGSRYYNVVNAPVVRDSAYALHNASISVGPKSDAWKLSIYAENIGNERYINSIFDLSTLGYTIRKFGRQRSYGVSFGARF